MSKCITQHPLFGLHKLSIEFFLFPDIKIKYLTFFIYLYKIDLWNKIRSNWIELENSTIILVKPNKILTAALFNIRLYDISIVLFYNKLPPTIYKLEKRWPISARTSASQDSFLWHWLGSWYEWLLVRYCSLIITELWSGFASS